MGVCKMWGDLDSIFGLQMDIHRPIKVMVVPKEMAKHVIGFALVLFIFIVQR